MKQEICCFTGHRIIKKNIIPFIKQNIVTEIRKLIAQGVTCFMAGGALGFDTLATQTVAVPPRKRTSMKI